jgi:hypothetical protein
MVPHWCGAQWSCELRYLNLRTASWIHKHEFPTNEAEEFEACLVRELAEDMCATDASNEVFNSGCQWCTMALKLRNKS